MRTFILIALLSVGGIAPSFAQQQAPIVPPRPSAGLPGGNQQMAPTKKAAGFCFPPGSPEYKQIKEFIPFVTLQDCLKSGGQTPKK
jgi:hypothetical protein